MKNKKLLTLITVAGLTIGGVTATAATAQDTESTESTQSDSTESESTESESTESESTDSEDGEREGRKGRRGHRGGRNLATAAEAIGIERDDLKAALQDGDSIADVAEANDVDVDTVIDAIVEAKEAKIAEKVEEGRLTAEEAAEKMADVEAKITDRVNGVERDNSESADA